MTFDDARDAVLILLRQQGKAKNSEMLAVMGGDTVLLEGVREDLLFAELAEDVRGAGLRYTGVGVKAKTDSEGPVKLFLSYGRRDASALADRLEKDLKANGYAVWRDTSEIKPGTGWQSEITDGLRSAQICVALMTPHSTRTSRDPRSPDQVDSICLGEIAYALFSSPSQPVVPVMVQSCEPPLAIFHLDYVDLRQWQDSDDQYQAGLTRLLGGIAAAQRGEKRYRSWHHLLDPFDFAAFLYAKREGFTGRQWLFDAIDVWRQSEGRDGALLIKGDPGSGKSAVVAELAHRNPGGQVLAYHCCQWDVAQTLEPWRFVRSIAAMIAGKLEDYAALLADPNVRDVLSEASCRKDPASAFERGILTPLQRLHAPEGGTRYLMIDALDEALLVPPGEPDLVSLIASRLDRLPPWLRILATTRKDPIVLERLGGLRAEEIDAQSPDNRVDLRDYIHARLGNAAFAAHVRASKRSITDLTAQLMEKSGGNFLYARQALDGVAAGIHPLAGLDALPPALRGMYAVRFEKLFPDEASFADTRSLLAVICAAQEPLGRDLLAEASGLNAETILPRVLLQLAAYVPRRTNMDGEITYAVYHKSFADWLNDPDRSGQIYHVDRTQGHRCLADSGWLQYQTGVASMRPYALRNLAHHLIEAARWNDLCTWLTDLRALDVRIRAGQVFAVVADQRAALNTLPELAEVTRLNRARVEVCSMYGAALAQYARDSFAGIKSQLPVPPVCPSVGESQVARSDRATKLLITANFIANHASILSVHPEDFMPLAANHSENGPLSQAATLLDAKAEHWILRSPRPPAPPLQPQCIHTLQGHSSQVNSVSMTPDGRRAVSGGSDNTIRVWDLESGQCVHILKGHTSIVTNVSVTSDGRRALSGSEDHTLRVWDLETGQCVHTLQGHINGINGMSVTPDGSLAVSGSSDFTLRVWDIEAGQCLRILKECTDAVTSVSVTPDGRRALAGYGDAALRFWDLETARCLHTLRGHLDAVISVSLSPDGSRAVSGGLDGTIRVWNLESGQCLHTLHGHAHWVWKVCMTPDTKRAISASFDRTLRLWDLDSGQCLLTLHGHSDTITSVSVTPDGRRAISGSSDNAIRVWNLESSQCVHSLQGHAEEVAIVCVTSNGKHVVSGSGDYTLRIWNFNNGRSIRTLHGHTEKIGALGFTPDGRRAISGSWDNSLRVWDLGTGDCLDTLSGHTRAISSLSVSPDGSRIVSGSYDNTLRIWGLDSGDCLHILSGHTSHVSSVISDDKHIVSGSGDFTLRVWDLKTGECLHTLDGHANSVRCVSITPDGRRALSASWDKTLRIWDLKSGQCLFTLLGHTNEIRSLIVTPDGGRAISVCEELGSNKDNSLRVWNLSTGQCVHTLNGHTSPVSSLSVSPDGNHVVSGSYDETVRVWNLITGQCLAVYQSRAAVCSVAVFSNGDSIVCGTKDGQMHFLTIRTFPAT